MFFIKDNLIGLKIGESLEIVVSKLVVGSGEQDISLIKIGKLLKWVWPRIPGTKRSNNLKWAIILVGNNWASFQEMLPRPDHL